MFNVSLLFLLILCFKIYFVEPRTAKWMRFNDMRVSDVAEDEVMNESVGGLHNSSAYILIYVEKSMLSQVTNTPDIFHYIPENLPIPESLKVIHLFIIIIISFLVIIRLFCIVL